MLKFIAIFSFVIFNYAQAKEPLEYVFTPNGVVKGCGCPVGSKLLCENDRQVFEFQNMDKFNENSVKSEFNKICKQDSSFSLNCYCYGKEPSRFPQSIESIKTQQCAFPYADLVRIDKLDSGSFRETIVSKCKN